MGFQSSVNSAISTIGQLSGLKKLAENQEKTAIEAIKTNQRAEEEKQFEILKNKTQGAEMVKNAIEEGLADQDSLEGKTYHDTLDSFKIAFQQKIKEGNLEEAYGIQKKGEDITKSRIKSILAMKKNQPAIVLSKTGDESTFMTRQLEAMRRENSVKNVTKNVSEKILTDWLGGKE